MGGGRAAGGWAALAVAVAVAGRAAGYYLPGTYPQEFTQGQSLQGGRPASCPPPAWHPQQAHGRAPACDPSMCRSPQCLVLKDAAAPGSAASRLQLSRRADPGAVR